VSPGSRARFRNGNLISSLKGPLGCVLSKALCAGASEAVDSKSADGLWARLPTRNRGAGNFTAGPLLEDGGRHLALKIMHAI
jgi:hypothetical protein